MDCVRTFFPRPTVWRNAFGSAGWDYQKENEYQRFRKAYLSSKDDNMDSPSIAQPKGSKEWRDSIHNKFKDTRKVASAAEHHARLFLQTRHKHGYVRQS
jgi:hypothetical protein